MYGIHRGELGFRWCEWESFGGKVWVVWKGETVGSGQDWELECTEGKLGETVGGAGKTVGMGRSTTKLSEQTVGR
jgi:hypothetical protein